MSDEQDEQGYGDAQEEFEPADYGEASFASAPPLSADDSVFFETSHDLERSFASDTIESDGEGGGDNGDVFYAAPAPADVDEVAEAQANMEAQAQQQSRDLLDRLSARVDRLLATRE